MSEAQSRAGTELDWADSSTELSTNLENVLDLSKQISSDQLTLSTKSDKLQLYSDVLAATDFVGRTDATADARQREAERKELGYAAALLAEQIRSDLQSSDADVVGAARAARDQIVATASYGDLAYQGYGINSTVKQIKQSGTDDVRYSAIYEAGQLWMGDYVTVDLGQAGLAEVTESPLNTGSWSPTWAASMGAGPGGASPDPYSEDSDHSISLLTDKNTLETNAGATNGNTGHLTVVDTDLTPDVRQQADGLFKFDLSEYTQYVTSANVTLLPVEPAGTTVSLTVEQQALFVPDDSWDVSTDWDGIADQQSLSPIATTAPGNPTTWTVTDNGSGFDPIVLDVTDLVRRKLRQGDANFDFVRGDTGTEAQIMADIEAFEKAVKDIDAYLKNYAAHISDVNEVLDRADVNRSGPGNAGVINAADAAAFFSIHGVLQGDIVSSSGAGIDGKVDAADIGVVFANIGQPGVFTYFEGDLTFNGSVDASDTGILFANFDHDPPDPALEKLSIRVHSTENAPGNTGYVFYATREAIEAERPKLEVEQDPDTVLYRFDATPDGNLRVTYNVVNEPLSSLVVKVYRSEDGVNFNSGDLLMEHTVPNVGDNYQPGLNKQISFQADFGSENHETDEDYYLVAKLLTQPTSGSPESTPDNNARIFSGGVFLDVDGTIQVQGNDDDNDISVIVQVGAGAVVSVSDAAGSQAYSIYEPGNIPQVKVRTHGGDDEITGDDTATVSMLILAGAGNDTLRGGGGVNFLSGGAGNDQNFVAASDPSLGLSALQTIYEEEGNDAYFFEAGLKGITGIIPRAIGSPSGNDTLDFSQLGLKIDHLDLEGGFNEVVNSNLTLFLADSTYATGAVDIENVIGTDFDDVITGNGLDNVLLGGTGSDTLSGGDGVDALFGDVGNDTFLVSPSESYLEDVTVDFDQEIYIEDGSGNANRIPAITSIIEPSEANNVVDGSIISIDMSTYVSDPDLGQTLAFSPTASLPTGANLSSAGMFTWTPMVGQAGQVYLIEFVVSDDHSVIPLQAESQFWVYVDYSVPNEAPNISDQTLPNPIDENSPNGAVVGAVSASDPVGGSTLTFSILNGNEDGIFAIDSSGQITVADGSQLDFELADVHELTVRVTDDGLPPLSSSAIVTINVSDVLDGSAPQFDMAPVLTVRKNYSAALRLEASDAEDSADLLTYRILGTVGPPEDTAPWLRATINDDVLNWSNGMVGTYTVTIEVEDTDQMTSTVELIVEVQDYNSSSPILTTSNIWYDDSPDSHPAVGYGTIIDRANGQGIVHDLHIQFVASDDHTSTNQLSFAVIEGPGTITSTGLYTLDLESVGGSARNLTVQVTDQSVDNDATTRSTTWHHKVIVSDYVLSDQNDGWRDSEEYLRIEPPWAYDQLLTTNVDTSLAGTMDHGGIGVEVTEFTVTSPPANGTLVGGLDFLTGDFTYLPNSGFRGIDSFKYQIESETINWQDNNVPDTLTTNEATVTILVGPTGAVDLITELSEAEEAAPPGNFIALSGKSGESQLLEVDVSVYLREDIHPSDAVYYLNGPGAGQIRVWDSASKTNEIFVNSTQWAHNEVPASVFVEAIEPAATNLSLVGIGGSDTVLLTPVDLDARFYRNGSNEEFDPTEDDNLIVWNLDRDENNMESFNGTDYHLLDYMKDETQTHAESMDITDDELVRMELFAEGWPAGIQGDWMVDFTNQKVRIYYEDPQNGNQITELTSGEWINGNPDAMGLVVTLYIEAIDKSTNLNDITIDPHYRELDSGFIVHEENLLTSIVGDLSLTNIKPVQVLYDVPMVIDKATIASIEFEWSNPYGQFSDGAWLDEVTFDLINVPGVGLPQNGIIPPGRSDISETFSLYTFTEGTLALPYVEDEALGLIPDELADPGFNHNLRKTHNTPFAKYESDGKLTANLGIFHPVASETLTAIVNKANTLPEANDANSTYTTHTPYSVVAFNQEKFEILVSFASFGAFTPDPDLFWNQPISVNYAQQVAGNALSEFAAIAPIPTTKIDVKFDDGYIYDKGFLRAMVARRLSALAKNRGFDWSVWILPDDQMTGLNGATAPNIAILGGSPHAMLLNESIATNLERDVVAHEYGHTIHGDAHPGFAANDPGWNIDAWVLPRAGDDSKGAIRNPVVDVEGNATTRHNYMIAGDDTNRTVYRWITRTQYLQLLGQLTSPVSPLRLQAETPTSSSPVIVSEEELNGTLQEATTRNEDIFGSQISERIGELSFQIVDLPNGILGQYYSNTVQIDRDAGGYGWFIDTTLSDDAEFTLQSGPHELKAGKESLAYGKVDLLTAVWHEIGHALGYGHTDNDHNDVMNEFLTLGTRRGLGDLIDGHEGDDYLEALDEVFSSLA